MGSRTQGRIANLKRCMKLRSERASRRTYMVVVHYPVVGAGVTPEEARSCFQKLLCQKPAELIQEPDGQPRQCFRNVANQVEQFGGEEVLGWLVAERCPGPNHNRHAECEAIAHSVWRSPDGRLIELTPGNAHTDFYPDPTTSKAPSTIYFVDSFDQAKRWYGHRPEILRVLLVAAGMDHVVDRGVWQFGIPGVPTNVQVAKTLEEWEETPTMLLPPGESEDVYMQMLLGIPTS